MTISRIIAWGREGIALTALYPEGKNIEVCLRADCSQVLRRLYDVGFFGPADSSTYDSPRMVAYGNTLDKLEAAIRTYARRGSFEKLLLNYDAIMAESTRELAPSLREIVTGLPLFNGHESAF
jgi:hypothetical protein